MSIVAFRKEGVDWNALFGVEATRQVVAFRKEGVDWNRTKSQAREGGGKVAFRKEGVDWNPNSEMNASRLPVAFRKEGVDWNGSLTNVLACSLVSPSARKVWIEMH